jgi:hypothetical protein
VTDSELISVIDTAYAKFRKEKGYCTEAMLRRAIADAVRAETIEQIAQIWDGCIVDQVDVGAAIRGLKEGS